MIVIRKWLADQEQLPVKIKENQYLVVEERDRAICILYHENEYWLPRSQINIRATEQKTL